jgi:tRNA-Thr(GGU) m(6)t(6)A37 methyltransferase TsaA
MTKILQIGVVHSPFNDPCGMPIQASVATGVKGTVEVDRRYEAGFKDIEGFSHIVLIYLFHASKGYALEARPFLDDSPRGLFSTRAPNRPNPIGMSTVRLVRKVGNILHVEDVDILDGTPLLDIKPYVPAFDDRPGARTGWLEGKAGRAGVKPSDERFQ